jgi:hypothetical protein
MEKNLDNEWNIVENESCKGREGRDVTRVARKQNPRLFPINIWICH